MSLRKLPLIQNFELPDGFEPGIRPGNLEKWKPELEMTNAADAGTVIEIYDMIGGDMFFGGVTSRQIASQLRGADAVTVNINSPGGSFLEGNAIYNMLMQHPGKVTAKVVGGAASAASIVLMAADEIQIASSGFIMIHNGQAGVEGDRHDMIEVATLLEKVDEALCGIYSARTGMGKREVAKCLDAETTFSAKEAIDKGFADKILEPGAVATNAKIKNEAQSVRVDRMMEAALQRTFPGLSRTDRLDLKNAYREGKPGAVIAPTRDAGMGDIAADLRRMLETI